jgi:transketolase
MKEMRDVFGETLVELGKQNERIIVLDADLNTSTKTDTFKKSLPSQFIQMGVAEQNMFGWAAGLATYGFIPFPTTFAVFAAKRACDQVSISIAYPRLNVKIAGCYCGISTGKAGATHQSVQDLAIMRSMPNMRVLAAADANELKQMMRAMVEYDGPVYFRVLRPAVPRVFSEDYKFDWKPVLLKEGNDVALITTGFMTSRGIIAAELLKKEGIKAAVVHVPCLKPLDKELIVEVADKCGAVVTAENHSIIGGLAGAVSEILAEECPVPIKRVGVKDLFVETGEDDDILRKYGLLPEDIVKAAKQIINKK